MGLSQARAVCCILSVDATLSEEVWRPLVQKETGDFCSAPRSGGNQLLRMFLLVA